MPTALDRKVDAHAALQDCDDLGNFVRRCREYGTGRVQVGISCGPVAALCFDEFWIEGVRNFTESLDACR